MALCFLKCSSSRAISSSEKLSQLKGNTESDTRTNAEEQFKVSPPRNTAKAHKDRMVLPFESLSVTFQDVQYYVETPLAMKERGFTEKRLQLLSDITGAFRPGVLTH